MTAAPDLLNIRLHLTSGETVSFLADTAPAVQTIVEQVRRGKVFTSQSLVIADEMHVSVFPGSAIVRLDLFGGASLHNLNTLDVGNEEPSHATEIEQEDWETATREMRTMFADRHAAMRETGTRIHAYGRLTLVTGTDVFLFEHAQC